VQSSARAYTFGFATSGGLFGRMCLRSCADHLGTSGPRQGRLAFISGIGWSTGDSSRLVARLFCVLTKAGAEAGSKLRSTDPTECDPLGAMET
jgi:hypothetical protein